MCFATLNDTKTVQSVKVLATKEQLENFTNLEQHLVEEEAIDEDRVYLTLKFASQIEADLWLLHVYGALEDDVEDRLYNI